MRRAAGKPNATLPARARMPFKESSHNSKPCIWARGAARPNWESSKTKQSSDKYSWASGSARNVELLTESGTRSITIVRIEPFTSLDDLR